MDKATVCTRCGTRYAEIDGEKEHLDGAGNTVEIPGCPEPVPGKTNHGTMKHVHSGTVQGEKVDVFIPHQRGSDNA